MILYKEKLKNMKIKSLMIISRAPQSGMRLIMMGIVGMLKRKVAHLALFKPLVDSFEGDSDVEFFQDYLKLRPEV